MQISDTLNDLRLFLSWTTYCINLTNTLIMAGVSKVSCTYCSNFSFYKTDLTTSQEIYKSQHLQSILLGFFR